jgi:hypothetical protein
MDGVPPIPIEGTRRETAKRVVRRVKVKHEA